MPDNNELKDKNADAPAQQQKQISIRIKQTDDSIHPLYSNITSVQGSKEIVMIDFGYLDIQLIASLSQLLKSGENIPNVIDAKMSCRVALNLDSVGQLIKQLSTFVEPQQVARADEPKAGQAASPEVKEPESSAGAAEPQDEELAKTLPSGFKFPWSK